MADMAYTYDSARQKDEEWRPVLGWEGFYEVSSQGRVRSADRTVFTPDSPKGPYYRKYRGRVLRQGLNVHGRHCVGLSSREGRYTVSVHVLVCEAFYGPRPSPNHDAAHNDGRPSNNFVNNLRWATKKENMADKLIHGTHNRGERHGNSKLTADAVREIKASSESHAALGRAFGVNYRTIFDIRSGKIWGHVQ